MGKVPKEEVSACGDDGCTVVFAILYTISEEDNDFLEPFFESAPNKAGEEVGVGMKCTLNIANCLLSDGCLYLPTTLDLTFCRGLWMRQLTDIMPCVYCAV